MTSSPYRWSPDISISVIRRNIDDTPRKPRYKKMLREQIRIREQAAFLQQEPEAADLGASGDVPLDNLSPESSTLLNIPEEDKDKRFSTFFKLVCAIGTMTVAIFLYKKFH